MPHYQINTRFVLTRLCLGWQRDGLHTAGSVADTHSTRPLRHCINSPRCLLISGTLKHIGVNGPERAKLFSPLFLLSVITSFRNCPSVSESSEDKLNDR